MSSNRSDFHLMVAENGSFLLTTFGLIGGCLSGLSIYFLNSRCSHIKLCCGLIDCVRQPIPISEIDLEANENVGDNLRSLSTTSEIVINPS